VNQTDPAASSATASSDCFSASSGALPYSADNGALFAVEQRR
jgi:hypothetical protein